MSTGEKRENPVRTFVKREWMPIIISLLMIAVVVGSVLGVTKFWAHFEKYDTGVNAALVAILVLVTALYTWHTREGARATEKLVREADAQLQAAREVAEATKTQADATTKLAAQAESQLRSSSRPLIQFVEGLDVESAQLAISNIGVGPATNIRCWAMVTYKTGERAFWSGNSRKYECPVLAAGAVKGTRDDNKWWKGSTGFDANRANAMTYIAVYEDILGNYYKSELSTPWPPNSDSNFSFTDIKSKEELEQILTGTGIFG